MPGRSGAVARRYPMGKPREGPPSGALLEVLGATSDENPAGLLPSLNMSESYWNMQSRER